MTNIDKRRCRWNTGLLAQDFSFPGAKSPRRERKFQGAKGLREGVTVQWSESSMGAKVQWTIRSLNFRSHSVDFSLPETKSLPRDEKSCYHVYA